MTNISWNRKEIRKIYDAKSAKFYKSHYPTKAKLLKQKYYKFSGIDVNKIEHLLRHMGKADMNKMDFNYCLDTEKSYNDCITVGKMDDTIKLQALQHNMDQLKQKYEELQRNYTNIYNKYEQLHREYQSTLSVDNNIDIVIQCLKDQSLNRVQYHNIMKTVLNAIKVNKSGHIRFETGDHVCNAIIVSEFNQNKESLLNSNAMQHHLKNLNNFIAIKCKCNDILIKHFMQSVISSNKWKAIIKTNLGMCDKLNKTQTIIQYIRSGGSLRAFFTNNAERNKLFGHRTTESEHVIRQAIRAEQLESEMYRKCYLEISDKEMKHNNGCKFKWMNTYYCDPTELICITLNKELITNGVICRTINGKNTLIVHMGMDKWAEGLMYSALLCTKTTNNNSPKRRRPVAFADPPAIESYHNVNKLLEPIRDELTLLKDNSCVFRIGNDCAILKCAMNKKMDLDIWRRQITRCPLNSFPKTMAECEMYKHNIRWNLINHNIDKLYIIDRAGEDVLNLWINLFPEIFICCDSINDIEYTYIYKYVKHTSNYSVQFERVGYGKFWGGPINLEPTEVVSNHGTIYFAFNSEADLTYLSLHDGGDLSGLDSRYNLGNHSSQYFCLHCQIDDKNDIFKDGTCYRTRYNILQNGKLFHHAHSINPNSKPSPLQMSKGVKGYHADPYPEASSVTPPLLHIDMGIMTHILDMHNICTRKMDLSVQIIQKKSMDDYKIFKNRYHHNIEGKQAKIYRQKFSVIAAAVSSTTFYLCMNAVLIKYNALMAVIGTSKPCIDESDCMNARRLLDDLDKRWTYMRSVVEYALSLGTKYHYLGHCVEYFEFWRLGLGFISEQSIENFHKTCSFVFRRYRNQRGLLRTKYSMHQLMLITSPLYQFES